MPKKVPATGSKSRVHTVHFSVTGEFVTDIARNLVLEGDWRHACRVIMEGLTGIGETEAYKILRGDAKLCGTNSMAMSEDDATEYKEALKFHFGSTFIYNKLLYKPYGYIVGVGQASFSWASERFLGGDRSYKVAFGPRATVEFANLRGLYYAKSPLEDIALFYDPEHKSKILQSCEYLVPSGERGESRVKPSVHSAIILCERVSDFPPFQKPLHDPAVAIENSKHLGAYGWRTSATLLHCTDYEGVGDILDSAILPEYLEPPAPAEVGHIKGGDSTNRAYYSAGTWMREQLRMAEDQLTTEQRKVLASERTAKANEEAARIEEEEAASVLKYALNGSKVRFQAEENGGFLVMCEDTDNPIKVPKHPFIRWALRDWPHLMALYPWENIFYSGYKMFGDNPDHTDWVAGAGLTPDQAYHDHTQQDTPTASIRDASFELLYRIQEAHSHLITEANPVQPAVIVAPSRRRKD